MCALLSFINSIYTEKFLDIVTQQQKMQKKLTSHYDSGWGGWVIRGGRLVGVGDNSTRMSFQLSNFGQILVKFWSNFGQILVKF